ncbi:TonB-dependent receptor plug domain-containing protein [Pelagicoccus mobilis]|uniref:TonB-dependent receptor plug domain-containing protein n=1 Tax=Pelagicoccus mobilis TaxID=415221 RepID=A0A934VPR7_9BACT|nr:TonB-dependent receptor plug domain-containing protein [Pelagicoccus mobilis]MBK1876095.1 TonB-dependent receptor plug domain-containing protein [Pelagicoccus mobilis]
MKNIPYGVLGMRLAVSAAVPVFAVNVSSQDADEDVFELSPFVIEANSEVGYTATQTLSGSRMRSKLSDVGASIDVLTDELLEDLGASDMYDSLDMVASVSTWQNSGGQSEFENEFWFQTPYVSRGFASNQTMLDFFERIQVPIDSYNTTNFTVARGPNSILYGIGSPGGVINATLKKPVFGDQPTTLQLRTDSNGSFRTSLDFNNVLVEDKLAMRVALLSDDRDEFLDPAGHEREAIYGTLTWKPFEGTSVNTTIENGSEDTVFRWTTASYDAVTPWLNAGSPTLAEAKDPINQSLGSGLDRQASYYVNVAGGTPVPAMNWVGMGRSEQFEIAGHPKQNDIRKTSFTDETAIYDIDGVQLMGEARSRELDWENFTVSLDQKILDNLQLQVAYNHAETEYYALNSFPGLAVHIDPNEQLPNGESNPNFLSPYIEMSRHDFNASLTKADTFRSVVSYDLDLNENKLFGFGLGRYNLMGMYEDRSQRNLFGLFVRANTIGKAGGGNLSNPGNRIRTRVYLDTDITPDGANASPYYTDTWNLIDDPGISSGWVRRGTSRNIVDTRDTKVAAVQGFLWKSEKGYERLILTAGQREDDTTSQGVVYPKTSQGIFVGENFRGNPFEADKSVVWDGTVNYGTLGAVNATDNTTNTYSAVFKPTMNIGLTYSYSDVLISASSLNPDIFDTISPPTLGETEDFGVRASFLKDKISTSLVRYTTSSNNATENNLRGLISPEVDAMWQAIDPSRGELPARYNTFRDDESTGYEFTATANLTGNWRARLAINKVQTTISSRLPRTDLYIAENLSTWEANRSLALDPSVASEDYQTVGDALDILTQNIADLHALEGTAPLAQREWKVVFNTGYNVKEGPLKNFGFGGGFIWEDNDVIGYAVDENSIVDSSRPFEGEELFNVNAFASYKTKVFDRDLKLQLNVRNLLDKDGTFPRQAIDDLTGNPYYTRQQIRAPRTFTLTATLEL